jgi:hypothetical protein
METAVDPSKVQQSLFVTVAAWVFIVLAGLGTVIAAMQNIMLYAVFSPEMIQKMAEAQGQNTAPMPTFIVTTARSVFCAALLLSIFGLVASIGLLKRRNWARRSIVALLVIGILWTVGGLVLQGFMFGAPFFHSPPANEFQTKFATMWMTMVTVWIVTTVGFSVLFGWLIKRLVSPAVRQEFV